jgi:hypothetical protein
MSLSLAWRWAILLCLLKFSCLTALAELKTAELLFSACLSVPIVFWLQSDELIKSLGVNNSGVARLGFNMTRVPDNGFPSQPCSGKRRVAFCRVAAKYGKD